MIGSIAAKSALEPDRLVDPQDAFGRWILGAPHWTSDLAPLVWRDQNLAARPGSQGEVGPGFCCSRGMQRDLIGKILRAELSK